MLRYDKKPFPIFQKNICYKLVLPPQYVHCLRYQNNLSSFILSISTSSDSFSVTTPSAAASALTHKEWKFNIKNYSLTIYDSKSFI